MARKSINASLTNLSWAHVPTAALLIGAIVFWLELFWIRSPYGHTTFLAWGLLLAKIVVQYSKRQPLKIKLEGILGLGGLLALAYLGITAYASFFPPHLVQEYDALNYHLMLPRQHLLQHSFAHIPWSVPDLFLLPLDYALSPFALATPLPNKLIQFVFFLGSLACTYGLIKEWTKGDVKRAWTGVFAVMAGHAIAIQAGTAMLDVVMLYCFLAALHSLWMGRVSLAAIEFTFYFWSKSFIPLQMIVIGSVLVVGVWLLRKKGFQILEVPKIRWKKFAITFGIASLFIAGPQVAKSLYYTGTALYPFGVGIIQPLAQHATDHWQMIIRKANESLSVKDDYGHGRGLADFIKHLWIVAVPEQGVNNRFDYPLGLVYLLVAVPFVFHVVAMGRQKKILYLSWTVIIWWMTWWCGSQQTRFLIIPVCLMTIITIAYMKHFSKVFICLVIAALGLETISLARAHRADWGKPALAVLREKDRDLLSLKNKSNVVLDFPDVAFAPVAVTVHNKNSVYVIPLGEPDVEARP